VVDCQLQFGCLLDGKFAWLGAAQYFVDVLRCARDALVNILAIGDEKTALCQAMSFTNGEDQIAQRELNYARSVLGLGAQRVAGDIGTIEMFCRNAGKDFIVVAADSRSKMLKSPLNLSAVPQYSDYLLRCSELTLCARSRPPGHGRSGEDPRRPGRMSVRPDAAGGSL
jgi:hypothetical protein